MNVNALITQVYAHFMNSDQSALQAAHTEEYHHPRGQRVACTARNSMEDEQGEIQDK